MLEGDVSGDATESTETESTEEATDTNGAGGVGDQAPESKKAQTKKYVQETDLDAIARVKIDGEIHEMPLREVLRLQSLEKASQRRMDQAKEYTKRGVQEFIELAKQDPDEFFRVTGIDPDEYSEKRLAKLYERKMMSEEQRRALELEEELKTYKSKEKEREEQQRKEQMKQMEQQELQTMYADIKAAWAKHGLPEDPYIGGQIAFLMSSKSGNPLTADQAAAKVKALHRGGIKSYLSTIKDPEEIRQVLGDEVLALLKKLDIERATAQAASRFGGSSKGPGTTPASRKAPEKMTELEYREYIKQLAAQG